MNKKYLDKMPKWVNDNTNYHLCLTSDMDSLWSCALLRQEKDWKINYYYNFNKIYRIDKSETGAVGVDLDLVNGKCFGNHVVSVKKNGIYNHNSVNLNVIDKINGQESYFQKYCGSTVLMLYSLYGVPLPATELGKMILLAIDGTFLGFYSRYENNNKVNKRYLIDVLEFPEMYKILERHKKSDFERIIHAYGLNKWINMHSGKLATDIDLQAVSREVGIEIALPTDEFQLLKKYNYRTAVLPDNTIDSHAKDGRIFSLAVTGRYKVQYSYI